MNHPEPVWNTFCIHVPEIQNPCLP